MLDNSGQKIDNPSGQLSHTRPASRDSSTVKSPAVERHLIRTRTAEARSRPKAQGKHMGCPPSLTPAEQKEAIRRRARGATLQELARSYNVSRATISRLGA